MWFHRFLFLPFGIRLELSIAVSLFPLKACLVHHERRPCSSEPAPQAPGAFPGGSAGWTGGRRARLSTQPPLPLRLATQPQTPSRCSHGRPICPPGHQSTRPVPRWTPAPPAPEPLASRIPTLLGIRTRICGATRPPRGPRPAARSALTLRAPHTSALRSKLKLGAQSRSSRAAAAARKSRGFQVPARGWGCGCPPARLRPASSFPRWAAWAGPRQAHGRVKANPRQGGGGGVRWLGAE